MVFAKLALLVQLIASGTFVDDRALWEITTPAPVYDATTQVLIVSAVPTEDVGCPHARFVIDTVNEIALAVYCDGQLLCTAGE